MAVCGRRRVSSSCRAAAPQEARFRPAYGPYGLSFLCDTSWLEPHTGRGD